MRRWWLLIPAVLLALVSGADATLNYRANALSVPYTADLCNYIRWSHTLVFNTPDVTLVWSRCPGSMPSPVPQGRLWVDGVAVTPWQAAVPLPPAQGGIGWSFTVPLPDGYYTAWLETSDGFPTYAYQVYVGADGPPAAPHPLPVTTTHYSIDWLRTFPPYNHTTIPYAGPPQLAGAPLALPAGLQPWGPAPKGADLWVYDANGLYSRDLARVYDHNLNGDTVAGAARKQCYFWYDIAGPIPPAIPGVRGASTICHLVKGKVHPQGQGFYVLSVGAGLFRWNVDGSLTCIFGACGPLPGANWPDPREATGASSGDKPIGPAWYVDRITWFGQGVDPKTMLRPWGFDAAPMPPPYDHGYHRFLLNDTFNGRILALDHVTAHCPSDPEGPGPCQQTTARVAVTLPGQQPWDVVYAADYQTAYVTIRKDPTRGALVQVNPVTGAATTIVRSAIDNPDCENNRQQSIVQLRTRYLIDGPFGQASLVCPNALAWNSQGRLFVVEQVTYALREIDLVKKEIRTVAPLTHYSATGREITLHIDTEGVNGARDDFFVASWDNGSDVRLGPTGALKDPKPGGSNAATLECVTGPYMTCTPQPNYPWLLAPGNAALPCMLIGNNAIWRLSLMCKKTPAQATLVPPPTFAAGLNAWRKGHGPLSALSVTHGENGDGHLGLPSWAAMAPCTDARVTAYLQAQGGLSTAEATATLGVIRWSAQSNASRTCGLP